MVPARYPRMYPLVSRAPSKCARCIKCRGRVGDCVCASDLAGDGRSNDVVCLQCPFLFRSLWSFLSASSRPPYDKSAHGFKPISNTFRVVPRAMRPAVQFLDKFWCVKSVALGGTRHILCCAHSLPSYCACAGSLALVFFQGCTPLCVSVSGVLVLVIW